MHLLRAIVAVVLPLTLAAPAAAKTTTKPRASAAWFSTGLHANDVEPLLRGIVSQGVQVAVFAGCFLALDDGDTCVSLAGRAKDTIEPRPDVESSTQ